MDRTDTMRRTRILRWASLSAALAACAAALAAVSLTGWSLFQPDTRYMVAIGRWIIENGKLPTSDPLTLHEGLAYICQQWPLCIAAAAIFDAATSKIFAAASPRSCPSFTVAGPVTINDFTTRSSTPTSSSVGVNPTAVIPSSIARRVDR